MTNVLLEDLVLSVRGYDADSFKGWLYEGLQELGEPVLTAGSECDAAFAECG